MLPVRAAADWQIPAIETEDALAAWLRATPEELEWFADLKRFGARSREEKLRHYNYRVLVKPGGNVRLIEAPKQRLKQMQRAILAGILAHIPAHDAAHGFQKGRSIKTFVAPHTGQRIVLRMDLRDFFPSIRSARVQALFRTTGYPERVADLLGGLCTTIAPRNVFSAKRVSNQEFTINPIALYHAWQTYALSAPSAGRAHLAGGCESLLVSRRLPLEWPRECGRRNLYAVRRRPGFFGCSRFRTMRRTVCGSCRGHSA